MEKAKVMFLSKILINSCMIIPHCGRKNVRRFCPQAFSTEEKLKSNVNDCFKINSKQMIKILKNSEYVRF